MGVDAGGRIGCPRMAGGSWPCTWKPIVLKGAILEAMAEKEGLLKFFCVTPRKSRHKPAPSSPSAASSSTAGASAAWIAATPTAIPKNP